MCGPRVYRDFNLCTFFSVLSNVRPSFYLVLYSLRRFVFLSGMKTEIVYQQMTFKNIWVPWNDEGWGVRSIFSWKEKWNRLGGREEAWGRCQGEKQEGRYLRIQHRFWALLKASTESLHNILQFFVLQKFLSSSPDVPSWHTASCASYSHNLRRYMTSLKPHFSLYKGSIYTQEYWSGSL